MKRLVEAFGADYLQWRALIRAYLHTDFAVVLGAYGQAQAWRALLGLAVGWGMLTLFGGFVALLVWGARDPFFAALVTVSTVMMLAMFVVVSLPASLATPDDLGIVGFRPVSSRTYFAVRLTAMLFTVLETAVLFGWLPVLAFATRAGGPVRAAAGAAAAILLSSVAVTTGVIAVYGWLIRVVSPGRLARAIGYAGAVFTLGLSVGVAVAIGRLGDSDTPFAFVDTIAPRDLRALWFPGAWFASYVPLVSGDGDRALALGALASVALTATFVAALRGRLSVNYAASVSDVSSTTAPPSAARRDWRFLRHETRAVALLVAAHLRSDVKFQLNVASSVVMGLAITAGSTGFQMPLDPFLPRAAGGGALAMPLAALVLVPMQVYQAIATTPVEGVAWPFFVTPADRVQLVTAGRDTIAIFVLLPLVLALGAFYAYAFGHLGHAAVHALFLATLAYLSLQISTALTPRLPFSIPLVGARTNPFPFWSLLLVMLIGMPIAVVIQLVAYRNAVFTAAALLLLVAACWALNRVTRRRIERQAGTLVYL